MTFISARRIHRPLVSATTPSCSGDPPAIDRSDGNHPVSRRTHGAAGKFDVDLIEPADGCDLAVECRVGGPSLLVIKFDRPIVGRDGLDPGDVELVGDVGGTGLVSAVWIDAHELTIELQEVPDGRFTLSFPGIADADEPTCGATDTLRFAVLVGDVNANGAVNLFDLIRVRDSMGGPVTETSFRSDVITNGHIRIPDLAAVRRNMDRTVPDACP